MEILKEIISDHLKYKQQIVKLAKTELKKSYKGTSFGAAWLFIKPAIRIMVYYFAFAIGLRQDAPVAGFPKFLWLLAGLIPWFYMQVMIPGGASCLSQHAYLVTKIKYPISTIPTFVSLANIMPHTVLVGIMIIIFWGFGYPPDIYCLQLILFIFLGFLFFTTWGLLAGVLGAMSRDFTKFMNSVTLMFFWLSGIIYSVNKIDVDWIRKLMLWNPITILVNGYRNSLIYKTWFWETPVEMRNLVIVYLIMLLLALWAFKKLRKDVPDVL